MALSRERKDEIMSEYTNLLQDSKAVFFSTYSGLTNKEMMALRRTVRDAKGVFRVVKLSIFEKALEVTGFIAPEDFGKVPIAVSFCIDEIPSVAKALTNYAKANAELVRVSGGLLPSRILSPDDVKALADLPPIDVIRAEILGLLDSPAANLVGVLQSGVSSVVNVLHAYTEQDNQAA